jgi:O-antigen/teichoic acid export membrane protein
MSALGMQRALKFLPGPARWVLASRSGSAQGSQVFVTSLLLLAVNLGSGIITARVLGPHGRGELAAITVWPQTVAYLATLGIPGAVVYYIRTVPKSGREVLTAAIALSMGFGLIATVAGVTIAAPLAIGHYGAGVLRAAQFFMLLAPAGLIGLVVVGALQARLEFRIANMLALAPPLMALILLLAMLPAHLLTPFTAALAAVIPSLLFTGLVLRYLFRTYTFSLRGLATWFRPLLGYGVRAYPIDLIGTFAASIDQAIVVGLVGPVALGWYAVALRGSRIVGTMQQAVAPVLFSRAAGRPREQVVAIAGRSARVTTVLAAVGTGVLALAANQVFGLIYGKGFLPATPVFRLLLLEALLAGLARLLGQAFFALGRPGTIAGLQAVGLGMLVALLLVLVPRFGILGAGLALLVSTTLRLIFILSAYPLVLGVRPPSFVLRGSDISWVREALQFKEPA